mmetsp:Transcript_14594/g.29622  ORF Transcript_14594/g.29622 Transcript_14594/m.29622 type:complete len:209 (-) Transcript_14594:85-711(-)
MVHQAGGCRSLDLWPVTKQAMCEIAARELMLPQRHAALTCLEERPEGCYYIDNIKDGEGMLFLNVNTRSRGVGAEVSDFHGQVLRLPICSNEKEANDNEDASAAPTRAPSVDFGVCKAEAGGAKKIAKGTCDDMGRDPILDASKCEEAAKELALADTTVEVTGSPNRPHGCYYFRNPEDLTSTLWLNTSPESAGRGAEPLRHILCAGP